MSQYWTESKTGVLIAQAVVRASRDEEPYAVTNALSRILFEFYPEIRRSLLSALDKEEEKHAAESDGEDYAS